MENFRSFRNIAATQVTRLDTKIKPQTTYSTYSGPTFFSSLAKIATPILTAQLPVAQIISQKVDKKLSVPNLIQGHNECGPTSLAMIEKYFGIDPGNYHDMFYSDTVGHGPNALKEKAAAKNLTVRQQNNGSLADLAALVDKGIPALVLGINGGGSNSTLSDYISNAPRGHWMAVTGYKKDDSGKITHIYFNNPNQSTTQCWTASDFQSKFWDNNLVPGGHRYYMAMAPRGTFQESLLKTYLPYDKTSDTFKLYLDIIDGLEDAFYTAEKAADEIASAADSVWDTITGWFS